jgi:glycosyltransferase involved in cell wall biosynthesis
MKSATQPSVLQVIKAPQHRGAEVFALQLSQALPAAGWQSLIVGLDRGDIVFARAAQAAGVWGGTVSSGGRGLPVRWESLRGLRAHLASAHFSIVQANGAATLKHLGSLKFAGSRVPLVYRSIGMPSYWRRDVLRKVFYRLLFRYVDTVVAVCNKARDELLERGLPADRVVVIPNGVDTSPFLDLPAGARRRAREAGAAAPADVVLVHVGSLSPEKNHGALIRLLARLRGGQVPARLWLVGEGRERGAIEREIEHAGVRPYVWLAGSREDVPAILAGADIFVLPSTTEGMPAALIEAGLSGLPAVAYDVGGVSEVIADGVTGWVVPASDDDALHAAVVRLAENPALRAVMARAAAEACTRFDIRRVAASYAAVYAGLAS